MTGGKIVPTWSGSRGVNNSSVFFCVTLQLLKRLPRRLRVPTIIFLLTWLPSASLASPRQRWKSNGLGSTFWKQELCKKRERDEIAAVGSRYSQVRYSCSKEASKSNDWRQLKKEGTGLNNLHEIERKKEREREREQIAKRIGSNAKKSWKAQIKNVSSVQLTFCNYRTGINGYA